MRSVVGALGWRRAERTRAVLIAVAREGTYSLAGRPAAQPILSSQPRAPAPTTMERALTQPLRLLRGLTCRRDGFSRCSAGKAREFATRSAWTTGLDSVPLEHAPKSSSLTGGCRESRSSGYDRRPPPSRCANRQVTGYGSR